MRLFRRCSGFVVDLFKGPGNHYWDLARIIATLAVLAEVGGQAWNIHLHKEIDLGPSGLGGGLASILTAAAVFLAAKTYSRKAHVDIPPADPGP
jgi:hypothetical protein